MRKEFTFIVLILCLSGVGAVSSTLNGSYTSRETIIGQFSSNVLNIDKTKANVLKDWHIEIGFNGDIRKLGNTYFIWFPAPINNGNYTLVIKDIIATENGFPALVDYEKEFAVIGEASYSISPGFIFSSDDFSVSAVLYEDFSESIEIDYPENRQVVLNPWNNEIEFEMNEFTGEQFVIINVGQYAMPSYLIGSEYVCGDGEIDSNEVCDGDNVGGESCASQGYNSGVLFCSSNCMSFNYSSCSAGTVCNANNLNQCSDENNCTSYGGYWYSNECNEFEEGAECDSEHLGICEISETCLEAGGYWYSNECNEFDEVVESSEILFRFNPASIRTVELLSSNPIVYPFRIDNYGGRRIENLIIEYDSTRFEVSPFDNIDIEANESAYFNLTLRSNGVGVPVRGALIASNDDVSEYMLFEVGFTDDEEEAEVAYWECSELSGEKCLDDDLCSGREVNSLSGKC